MVTIGQKLRSRRLSGGVDLEVVARQTKISSRFLEAIEDEDWDKLPGGVFRKSFIRQYARALGVDESEIEAELSSLGGMEPELAKLAAAVESNTFTVPAMPTAAAQMEKRQLAASATSFLAVVAVIAGCAGIYTLWQTFGGRVQSAVQQATSPAGKRTEEARPQAAGSAPASAPAATAAPASEPLTATQTAAAGAPQPPPAPVEAPAEPPAAAPAGSETTAALDLSLAASDVTWISITQDGKWVFSGELKPGQTRSVKAAGEVVIKVGNAAGLELNLNGKPLGPLGAKDEVRRVRITPSGLQTLPRKAPGSEAL